MRHRVITGTFKRSVALILPGRYINTRMVQLPRRAVAPGRERMRGLARNLALASFLQSWPVWNGSRSRASAW